MLQTTKSSTLLLASIGTLVISVFFFLLGTQLATALFIGPSQNPPSAPGAMNVDTANNVGVGTSTAGAWNTRFLVVPSGANTYGFRVLRSNQNPALVVTEAGRVGIATSTTPLPAELTVQGDAIITGTLTAGSITGQVIGSMNAANVSSGTFGANTGGGVYSFPSNLGIGTVTAATTSLWVVGSRTGLPGTIPIVRIQNILEEAEFVLDPGGIGPSWTLSANDDSSNDRGFRIFSTSSSDPTPRFAIAPNGYVGIGTDNPAVPLHLVSDRAGSNGTIPSFTIENNREEAEFRLDPFGSNNSWTFSAEESSPQLRIFDDSSTLRFAIDSSGNIGIATTTPRSTLHVTGSGYIQLETRTSVPPSTDCDVEIEAGRMKYDATNDTFYTCSGSSGWVVIGSYAP